MSKTNSLKIVIQSLLDGIEGETYQRVAPETANFPYKVFNIESVDLGDLFRDDSILEVNVWDCDKDTETVDNIADEIEALFNTLNYPTDDILPTFYKIDRKELDDPEPELKRVRLRFQVRSYERND